MTRAINAGGSLDGGLVSFEIRDGVRRISCTVADEALEAVSGLTAPSTPAVRRESFARFRTLIDAAAKLKISNQPPGFTGPLVLSSSDLRRIPPENGRPAFGSLGRSVTRPAGSVAAASPAHRVPATVS